MFPFVVSLHINIIGRTTQNPEQLHQKEIKTQLMHERQMWRMKYSWWWTSSYYHISNSYFANYIFRNIDTFHFLIDLQLIQSSWCDLNSICKKWHQPENTQHRNHNTIVIITNELYWIQSRIVVVLTKKHKNMRRNEAT